MTVEKKNNYAIAFTMLVTGLKRWRQFFQPMRTKTNRTLYTRDFSRALSESQVIAGNCDWLIALFASVVGWSKYFGFDFSTVI